MLYYYYYYNGIDDCVFSFFIAICHMNMRTVDTLFLACRSTLVLAKLLSDTMFG